MCLTEALWEGPAPLLLEVPPNQLAQGAILPSSSGGVPGMASLWFPKPSGCRVLRAGEGG